MRRFISLMCCILAFASMLLCVSADGGKVIYSGDSGEFIFEPGSKYSPTDLFTDMKGVMPGDSITQQITVRNDASKDVKVKIYIRSLGAHEESEDFLSALRLKVQTSVENEMAYMFDAAASETAQLTDWVYLGMLYSGGEVNLDVTLDVPVELGNEYSSRIGYLDWEFMIEEFPTEPDDPEPPFTGDETELWIWVGVMCVSLGLLVFIIVKKKREDKENEKQNKEPA